MGNVAELNVCVQTGFQTIVANPPYQKNISGSTSEARKRNASKAVPVYHDFVHRAKTLKPRLMSFIMPAKWYTGGWALDEFRASMLADTSLSHLVDFRGSEHVFAGTDVNGGIAVLLWDARKTNLNLNIVRFDLANECVERSIRALAPEGANFVMRDHRAMTVLERVGSFRLGPTYAFTDYVVGGFGMNTNYASYQDSRDKLQDPIALFRIGEQTKWMERKSVPTQHKYLDSWKIFIPLSHSERGDTKVGRCHVFGPGSACTHSYLAAVFDSEAEARSALSYIETKTFRFLVGQLKISPIATRQVYRLVPKVPLDRTWTDEALALHFELTDEDVRYIDSTVGAPLK